MPGLTPVPNWDLEATWATFQHGTFHGVIAGLEIQKSADDLERYRWLVDTSQPDIVIETGTRAGGSAVWFQRELGLQVISIDRSPQFTRGVPQVTGLGKPGIKFILGDSADPAMMSQVLPDLRGKRVMVSLDADHHSVHVQREIALWSEVVSPGCFLVVEDGCFDLFARAGHGERARVGGSRIPEVGGALAAIERTLGPGGVYADSFWRDESIEAITPVSHSPVGFWRKHD